MLTRILFLQLIYTNHFGGTDEAALQIQALESRAASVLPAASGASHSQGRDAAVGVKSTASGDVKAILFLDLDVIYWTLARQMSQQQGSFDGTNMPSLDATRRRLGSHRWLVVACENKIVAHDLTSPEVIDLPRSSLFEGKIPTTISLLLSNSRSLLKDSSESKSGGTEILPLLAVGTNAGSIFVVSIDKLKVHSE